MKCIYLEGMWILDYVFPLGLAVDLEEFLGFQFGLALEQNVEVLVRPTC